MTKTDPHSSYVTVKHSIDVINAVHSSGWRRNMESAISGSVACVESAFFRAFARVSKKFS
jgi:hypothetical protein